MSWRSRTHPSGIKTPACPSRGWRLPENAAGSVSTKSPCSKPWEGFLLAAGSPRWQCPLLPLAALGSTQAAGAVAAGLPWLAQQAWLGWMLQLLGFSGLSCHCLFWPFPAAVVAVRMVGGSLWQCYRLWWTKNQPFVEICPFSYCDSSFWAQAEKNVTALVLVGWIIAVCCLWAERIESLWLGTSLD